MPFYLTLFVSGQNPRIELSCDEYEGICTAQRGVKGILLIEESFNMLLGNYADFEKTMLEISLEHSIFSTSEYRVFTDHYYEVNRRVLNLLAAGRLYLDHVPHYLTDLLRPNKDVQKVFDAARKAQYDGCLGFRVMEALRNYAQHRELPAHRVSIEGWNNKHSREHRIKHTVTPYLRVSRLKGDSKFKSQVAEELTQKNQDCIDLKPFIREYISGLGHVHAALRHALKSSQQQWVGIVDETCRRYSETGVESLGGLRAAEFGDDDYPVNSLDIVQDVSKRLQWLQERNGDPVHFQKRSVTSEVKSES
jgi:hypothetical protein